MIRRNLRRERLDEADVAEKARLDGIGSMDDIRAVLETTAKSASSNAPAANHPSLKQLVWLKASQPSQSSPRQGDY
jgi:uncharacterized membrane protein YcaP (DUF421 family)